MATFSSSPGRTSIELPGPVAGLGPRPLVASPSDLPGATPRPDQRAEPLQSRLIGQPRRSPRLDRIVRPEPNLTHQTQARRRRQDHRRCCSPHDVRLGVAGHLVLGLAHLPIEPQIGRRVPADSSRSAVLLEDPCALVGDPGRWEHPREP